jgi:GrpB-like predicted nucleotidyltransferase (UPF0157 family)
MTVHPLWRPFEAGRNVDRQSERVAHRQTSPGALRPHESSWAVDYDTVRRIIETALAEKVLRLTHVGSTAIPGVVAKPVIDVDLLIADVSQEATYLPPLEAAGFRLIFRDDMAGDPHHQLTFAEPNTNLHIWNPDAVEPRRHELFAEWLAHHADDRQRYSDAKAAVADDPAQNYNDAKAATIYDIYERAFAADPAHEHTPQPRR